MRFKIVYDNESLPGFKNSWGFACLVDDHLLFDTGADSERLLFNLHQAKVNLSLIDTLVLSHDHGDHTGGLGILEQLGSVRVFVPRSFSSRTKKRILSFSNVQLIEIQDPRVISTEIMTTGELGQHLREQSLIVTTGKGLVIVTGCSHPGIAAILHTASKFGTIYGIIGGFHDFNRLELFDTLQLIVPCHCTRAKRVILQRFKNHSQICGAGLTVEI